MYMVNWCDLKRVKIYVCWITIKLWSYSFWSNTYVFVVYSAFQNNGIHWRLKKKFSIRNKCLLFKMKILSQKQKYRHIFYDKSSKKLIELYFIFKVTLTTFGELAAFLTLCSIYWKHPVHHKWADERVWNSHIPISLNSLLIIWRQLYQTPLEGVYTCYYLGVFLTTKISFSFSQEFVIAKAKSMMYQLMRYL